MKLKFTTLLLLFSCCSLGLLAQATDVLQLRSGKVITGEIVAYIPSDKIILRKSSDGLTQSYPMEAVEKVQQLPANVNAEDKWWILVPEVDVHSLEEAGNDTITTYTIAAAEETTMIKYKVKEQEAAPVPNPKPVYEFKERAWFQHTSFAFSFGKREREDILIFNPGFEREPTEMSAIGFNVQHIAGFQFNRLVGVGVGASYDAYELEDGESILTFFGHYRAYLSKRIIAPFFALNAGYGIALRNKDEGIMRADGGWMIHPELGLRLGATNKANFTVSIGYRLQDASYVQERPLSGDIEYRYITYKRFLFSLGLLF